MRILQIFDGYGTPGERALAGQGSIPTVVYYLAKYAREKGHEVTVLERDLGSLPAEEEIDGIRYVRIKAKKLPKAPYELVKSPIGLLKLLRDGFDVAKKIDELLKRESFDIIHLHFPFASSILVSMRRDLRKKTIYTLHADEFRLGLSKLLKPPLAARVFSPDLYLIKRAEKVVVLNEPLKEKLVKRGIDEEKIEVIPNGVNVEEFRINEEEVRMVKAKYGLNEFKGVIVMFAGTVIPRKGVEYLIKAGEILKDENTLFLIVGRLDLDREYAERVVEYAKRKRINAKFTGFVPREDLKALYAACDIFVLPSLGEGFPVALVEALPYGKPVIGSRAGGIPMLIRDGWNGFLVEPANERDLAEKIRYLIENEDLRKRMGMNSRRLAEEEFDWRRVTEKYLKVYEEIMK